MEEPDLEEVFEKPGSQWSEFEVQACLEWLCEKRQWKKMGAITGRHLGPLATGEDAEDFYSSFVAGSLLNVIRLYDPDRGRDFESYFTLCLKRECWKRQKLLEKIHDREQALADFLEDAEPPVEGDKWEAIERQDRLRKAFHRIRPQHAAALKAHYFHGKSIEEIARETGVRPGTVKSWLDRGRDEMQEALKELGSQKQRG